MTSATAFGTFLLSITAPACWAADTPPVSFNRDIRPIMSDTCFRCHGPDKSSRMANLRLDLREEATKPSRSGVTPIVPGHPEQSAIVTRILATDGRIMPPSYAHKQLTTQQKETIRQWVGEGAKYEGHWAYQPVTRPALPAVNGLISETQNPIDRFVQDRLAAEHLQPSPEADRRTLMRRVSLDLTGLPPTTAEVDAFLADRLPGAYERVTARLLASPRYAEQQTLHWLDTVRYADSAGYHGDNEIPVWPYRDYVLRAFHNNKPFDQFTREQLAGDLIPNATSEQKIASAYNRLGRMSAEGGLQPKEYIAKYGADRVRTVSLAWMGSTLGCAECHDHKFDPFKQRDFYAMKAFFADIQETGLVRNAGKDAWGVKLSLPTDAQTSRLSQLAGQIAANRASMDAHANAMVERRAEWEQTVAKQHAAGELAWEFQHPVGASATGGAKLTIFNGEPVDATFYIIKLGGASLVSERKRGNGTVVASGPNPDNSTYTVTLKPGAGKWTALGLQVFQDEGLPGCRFARGADRFLITSVDATLGGQSIPLALATTNSYGETPDQGPMNLIDGNPKTGWAVTVTEGRSPFVALRFAQSVKTTADSTITVQIHQDSDLRRATVGRFRLALSKGTHSWPESGDAAPQADAPPTGAYTLTLPIDLGLPKSVSDALAIPAESRNADQSGAVLRHFEWSASELQAEYSELARLENERNILEAQEETVLVTQTSIPRPTRVLPRGDWMNDSGPLVEPAVPGFLGAVETGGKRATRLDLANWLVSDRNPLTARVFVNRVWRQFFGTGISKILEDMGSQGEAPTHLALLDWLASEFMHPEWNAENAHPWDVKHLVQTIVLSHTYRQASVPTPELDERDPENRLLARQSRFRVDAETVHDIALASAGLLVQNFGGPSVRPYQPDGFYAAMNFPKREYAASRGSDLYRRGLYTIWQRTFLHPMLANFDAPSREECAVNRVNSNTPLQSLDLLNDPIFVEAARVLAQGMLSSGGTTVDSQLDWAFRRTVSRSPLPAEIQVLKGLHQKALTEFRAAPQTAAAFIHNGEYAVPEGSKPADLAAMATVARVILNLHETITRN